MWRPGGRARAALALRLIRSYGHRVVTPFGFVSATFGPPVCPKPMLVVKKGSGKSNFTDSGMGLESHLEIELFGRADRP